MQTTPTPEVSSRLAGFEEFVQNIIKEWKIQGLAMAIVKDGEVIFSKGFGLRDVANGLEVTPHTLFPIASCTKAFTTAAMAILVDDGKLDWDTPVRHYLPNFKLYDPFMTDRMTPRDLVSHRSGLPRHDLMWYNSSASRQELFDRLQYLEPTKDFRAVWQYQNLMFMTAGYLVGQVAGQSWEEFVQKRIFDVLGMKSSNFSIETTIQEAVDYAHPYREVGDEVKEIAFYAAQGAIAPAGAIVSNVEHMSKWVMLHLNKGKVGDRQVISESQMVQLHTPQMVIPGAEVYKEVPYTSYALGWFVQPYRGYSMLHHGGNIDGFSSLTSFLPDENIGMVVFTNLNHSPVPVILTYNAAERLLGLNEVPWSERSMKLYDEMKEAEKKGKEKSGTDAVPNTKPSHPLEAYTGDYAHPGYGTISIKRDGDQLKAIFNHMEMPLKHYHYDIFEMAIERFELSFKVSFIANVKGDVDTLVAPFEPTVSDIIFRRVAGKELTDKRFLEQFLGEYEVMSASMFITLKGENALLVSIPGQPDYELTPYKGTEFQVKGLSGFSIEFKQDEAGTVTEALITQLSSVFTAKKKVS